MYAYIYTCISTYPSNREGARLGCCGAAYNAAGCAQVYIYVCVYICIYTCISIHPALHTAGARLGVLRCLFSRMQQAALRYTCMCVYIYMYKSTNLAFYGAGARLDMPRCSCSLQCSRLRPDVYLCKGHIYVSIYMYTHIARDICM